MPLFFSTIGAIMFLLGGFTLVDATLSPRGNAIQETVGLLSVGFGLLLIVAARILDTLRDIRAHLQSNRTGA